MKQVTISILSFHCCDFLLRGSGLEEPADRTLLDWPTTDHSSTIFDKKSWIEWYRWKSDGNMYSWEGARTVIYWTLWCIFKIHVSFSRPQEKRDRYRLLQMKTNISHVVWGFLWCHMCYKQMHYSIACVGWKHHHPCYMLLLMQSSRAGTCWGYDKDEAGQKQTTGVDMFSEVFL